MKHLAGLFIVLLLLPTSVMSQAKDWRRMERKKVTDQVRSMNMKNGPNEVAAHPKGFKLYAIVKDGKINEWQAKGARGKKLKITKYDYPVDIDESTKEPGKYKMLVLCIEDKEVCYEVQLIRLNAQ